MRASDPEVWASWEAVPRRAVLVSCRVGALKTKPVLEKGGKGMYGRWGCLPVSCVPGPGRKSPQAPALGSGSDPLPPTRVHLVPRTH